MAENMSGGQSDGDIGQLTAAALEEYLIEIYAFERVYLRAWQMDAKQKGRGRTYESGRFYTVQA